MTQSELEAELAFQIRAAGLPRPEVEFRFCDRKSRFDFAWPLHLLAVEVEGGTWMKRARHTSGTGFEKDCRKYAEAVCLGWRVIRVTSGQVKSGEALAWIERALGGKNETD